MSKVQKPGIFLLFFSVWWMIGVTFDIDSYTLVPKTRGYDLALRRQALKLSVDGTNFRRIARHLSVNHQTIINWVNHQTVINWVNQAAANLPAPPLPKERQKEAPVETLELDELFTFVSQKKSRPTC